MASISKSQIKLIRSLQHKKYRDELGLFVAEGQKCIEELKKSFDLVVEVTPANATESEIAQMSGLKTPQGEIGVFKKRPEGYNKSQMSDLTLAIDGVQDPGNLGTIIRTCDWFGVHQIVCSKDTADCYNPKVIQATMGSLTRVQLIYTDLSDWLREQKRPIYGTLLDGKNMYDVLTHERVIELKDKGAIIVMGNEGNGISQEVRKVISNPILIPSYPSETETSESLNVAIATAIVLAEFRRLR